MSIRLLSRVFLVLIINQFMIVSHLSAADGAAHSHTIAIADSRSGSGPCGFVVQRDLEGTVTLSSHIDESGQLVLSITRVDLHGTLTNPETGKSVDIIRVHNGSDIAFADNGDSVDIVMALTGSMDRGYDTADSSLSMNLPLDGVETLAFTSGERSEDPWTHVCGQLA